MNEEVYIVVFDSAGFIESVTITENQDVDNAIRQLRNPPGGKYRRVRKITDRDEYLKLLDENYAERKRNINLMRQEENLCCTVEQPCYHSFFSGLFVPVFSANGTEEAEKQESEQKVNQYI